MAELIQNLPEPDSYNSNESWALIEHQGSLKKIKASVLLDTFALQSEFLDSDYKEISFQDSSISFSKSYLLNSLSSFILTLEFGDKIQFPSATIIKNSGETFCKLITFEAIYDILANTQSDTISLSSCRTQDGLRTDISAKISITDGASSAISIDNLALQNVSENPSTNYAYCCAKIKGRALSNA